jgi:hypothetical protein
MKTRNLALCGASLLLLGSLGTAIADPQTGDPYTQNPTPQERAQTDQLNAQASQDATTNAAADSAAQSQYDQKQQQYQDQSDAYKAQHDRYQDEKAEYNYDRSHPLEWWHDRYEHASLDRFYDIPRSDLMELNVDREDGYRVGHIVALDRDEDGRVSKVKVSLKDGDVAWLDAHDLRYNPDERLVFTDLTVSQIRALARNS